MSEIPVRSGPDAMEDLVLRFHPFIRKWATYARQSLTSSDDEEVFAQVRCLFLSLVHEFDTERGVPFVCYAMKKLPQRVMNWLKEEWLRFSREVSLDDLAETVEAKENLLQRLWEEDIFVEVILREWWREVLEILPEAEKQVMILAVDGQTERQIAVSLGLSRSRVNELKTQAQAKLWEHWKLDS